MGHAHVGPHEAGVRRHGRAHERAVSRTHRRRTRHRLQRAGREEAHPLQGEEGRELRRTRLHLLQCRAHRGKLPRQGERREGLASRGKVFDGRPLPRLRWHAPIPGRAATDRSRHQSGTSNGNDARRSGGMGRRRACKPSRRNAPHGEIDLRIVRKHGSTLARARLGLFVPRPSRRDPLHRRAPARATRALGAKSNYGRAVRDGRAVHRFAPRQHRRAFGRYARSHRRWQLGGNGRSRHAHPSRGRPSCRDGPRSRRPRRRLGSARLG